MPPFLYVGPQGRDQAVGTVIQAQKALLDLTVRAEGSQPAAGVIQTFPGLLHRVFQVGAQIQGRLLHPFQGFHKMTRDQLRGRARRLRTHIRHKVR